MEQSVKDILADDFWIMPATPEYIDEGVPYITSKNIKNGIIDFTKVNYISQDAYENISKNRPILVGDILISMIGTLGETAEVKESDGSFYGQNMFLVRLDESKINKRYFLNFFKSNCVKRALEGKQNQSTQKYLKANHIEDLIIPVPALDEQKLIAKQLDKLAGIIALRNEELKYLDNLIKARFVELFGEGLKDDGRFPLLPISEIGKVVSGATPKTSVDEFWDGNNLWITPAELSEDSFIVCDSVRKITDEGVRSCAVNLLPVGTVILSSRAPIGKVAIAGCQMYCNQGFKNIIPNGKINSIYLYELLGMETEYLNSLGRGATFKEISKQIVESIKIKVPPIDLQNQFADFVKQIAKSKLCGKLIIYKKQGGKLYGNKF